LWKQANGKYDGFGDKWLLGRVTRLGAIFLEHGLQAVLAPK